MSKPKDSEYICWIDLETSGNRPTSQIIEIGMVITDRKLNTVQEYSAVIKPSEVWEYGMDEVVKAMHENNGLIRDVKMNGRPVSVVDAECAAILKGLMGKDHMPLGGSGISHFDRKYIWKDMPLLDKQLSYWHYDVGTLRRFLELFGIDTSAGDTTDKKTHRALDDIKAHIEEAQNYRRMLQSSYDISSGAALRRFAGGI